MTFRTLLGALFACAVLAGASWAGGTPRELRLCDFEEPAGGFSPGGEFTGAQGDFAVDTASAHAGNNGGRLTFDLTRGAYVAWGYALPAPLAAGAQAISLWARIQTPDCRVHCKTRDATGQEHIRYGDALPAGEWTRLRFDVEKMQGHWNGANDGKIHWPITYVQIGVEARGKEKRGVLEMDDLSVATTATRAEQPGAFVALSAGGFGNLLQRGSAARVAVAVRPIEFPLPERYAGTYEVRDWQDAVVAQGAVAVPVRTGEAKGTISLRSLPAGAFRVKVALRGSPDEEVIATSSIGVLPGPNPPPCPWVGTGLHAGHGWGHGDLRFLDILSAAGIGVVREEFGWSGIERQKGVYATNPRQEAFVDGLVKRGINLNLLLTYGNGIYENPLDPDAYARWAGWMAEHFRGRVRDFEIWNEPANFAFQKQYGGERWGNAPWIGKFVDLSLKAGAAIRAARPDANVVLCAEDVWPTLRQMLAEGIGPAGNVISTHPYCHGQPRPEREWFLNDGGRELRRVSREHGGPQRVVVTEAGWTTYDGEMQYLAVAGGYPRSSPVHQAQYVARMYLTARAAGADYAIQYDFRDDGANRSYTEHNFGLVREDYSPKPSLMAVAALTRLLGQGRFVRDVAPDPEVARAYLFDVKGKPVVAAYAVEKDMELVLLVGANRVELVDLMGNRRSLATPGGVARLALTETPVYVVGGRLETLARFARLEMDDTELRAAAGDTVESTLRLENHTGLALRPTLTGTAAGALVEVRWPGGSTPEIPNGGSVEVTLAVRLGQDARERFPVTLSGTLGAMPVSRQIWVQTRPPVSVRFEAAAWSAGRWHGAALLTNESRRPLQVRAEVAGAAIESRALDAPVAPGQSVSLPYAVERWPEEPLRLRATVQTADGWRSQHEAIALPASVPLLAAPPVLDGDPSDWPAACTLPLADASQYAGPSAAWGGPDDLSATVRLAACPEGLCVAVQTRDNQFHQPHDGPNVWQADSVQLALAPVAGDRVGPAYLEISLARTPAGDRCFPGGPLANEKTWKQRPPRLVTRPATGGGLTYEALIPWALVPGIRPEAGAPFAFSLLVNDNDGQGRRGWLEAFSGIGWSKQPALFGKIVLERLGVTR